MFQAELVKLTTSIPNGNSEHHSLKDVDEGSHIWRFEIKSSCDYISLTEEAKDIQMNLTDVLGCP